MMSRTVTCSFTWKGHRPAQVTTSVGFLPPVLRSQSDDVLLSYLSLAIHSFPLGCYKLATDCHSKPKVRPPQIIFRTAKKTWSQERKGSVLLTGGAARRVEGEHSLNGDVHGRDIEGFEHDLEGHQGERTVSQTSQHLLAYRMLRNFLKGKNYAKLSGPPSSHIHLSQDLPWWPMHTAGL